jgi:hypothetical protein
VSDINFISINENFPVPGQDNDTQVFRDNFDTIKRNFQFSKNEITDLQDNAARKDEDNEFERKQLRNLVLGNSSVQSRTYGNALTTNTEISFIQGLHHVVSAGGNINITFSEFPGSVSNLLGGMGKITVELYGDGSPRTISFNQPNGTLVKTCDFPSPTLTVQSTTNPILLEVWKRDDANILFIKYLGQFV